MMNKLSRADVYDVSPTSGALILGSNRLDDYASKYLSHVCCEALTSPIPLPVEGILAEQGLTVIEVRLSRNLDIFGCCLLLDSDVQVYNPELDCMETSHYPAGTILIDPDFAAFYGEGAKRNTLMHEALHWEKDKRYFEILQMKNKNASETLYPIMCRASTSNYTPAEGLRTKANEVQWLEWQAHKLAPRVLMPAAMFKKKAIELIESYQNQPREGCISCDTLIEDLSNFFIVSRASVKYRLIEVGLLGRISVFEDYDAVFADINRSKELVALTPAEAYQLLSLDSSLRTWVNGGQFVFADGYFVLADEKYVTAKEDGLHLTTKAKKNLTQCVINIHEQKYTVYNNVQKDLVGYAVLHRVEGIDQRLLTFHPQFQTNFQYDPDDVYKAFRNHLLTYDENEEVELVKRLADPTTTLCQCLWYLMENRKWNYPETFNEMTGLHKNYHGKIKKNDYNNMGTVVLMTICVALRLKLRIVEQIFEKSNNKLNYYQDPDKTYIRILESMPGLSLQDFNSILVQYGIKELGSTLKGGLS